MELEYEKEGLLHEMFKRQVKSTPNNVAVVSHDTQMTYRELDEITDIIAVNLRIKGVQPDSIIGIYMERCVEYVIAYISILKSGGSYMPIDVSYPIPLLEDIFSDSEPVAVFTEPSLTHFLPESAKNVYLCIDDWINKAKEENAQFGKVPEMLPLTLDNLAYTVYSSGTTGKPKGIQCPHRGAVFSYTWRHEAYPYGENEREGCNVFFVWEFLRPLLKGVTMYIVPDTVIYDPKLLAGFIKKNCITRILFTPSLLEAVLDADGLDLPDSLASLRMIIFCGEVVTTGLLERCIKLLPQIQYVNLYSVSEAHDISCFNLSAWYKQEQGNIKNRKFCPVGKLLPGVTAVILDDKFNCQPVGVAGEIYVGGPALARGYLNRPELNAQRFIPRPESVHAKYGNRLYKTGDWGYMLSDGNIEICGRCDSMVKIRGYSIETQAVEAALLELPLVNACVVVVLGDEGEDKYLVAYIVPEGTPTKKDIRAALKRRLPFYMIPSYFVLLSSIPILAASGKLDKRSLPPVDKTENEVDPEGVPSTETEHILAGIWAQVLSLTAVDIQESFFDLGGHSLLATKLLSNINEKLKVELTVKDLFVHPTVFSLAKVIDNLQGRGSGEDNRMSPTLDLIKEVERHSQPVDSMDIQLRAFWRSMQYWDRWNKARVLLTGATGFLGAFILRDLLNKTKTQVFCIVRESPDDKAADRVRNTLIKYGMLASDQTKASTEQKALDAKFQERVTGIKGDVGLVNMGMTEEDYTYLCTEIDVIIHAAAYVNLIYPYQALHGPNVLGTENVIMFACTSKVKPLHYISTDAVYPHGLRDCDEDTDMKQYANDLTDGYAQSKWVAEQLVIRAMERGLPAAIFRPGNLAGDSRTAHWNEQDFTLLVIQAVVKTGFAPDISWDMEFTPVDFVSNFVVSMTQRMALGLGKVFNLPNPNPVKARWLFEWLSAHGYPLKMVPYETWLQKIERFQKHNGKIQRLLDSLAKAASFFAQLSTYKNDNVQQVLRILKLDFPEIDNQLLKTYFTKLVKLGILPAVRRNTTLDRPLEGQVAIVTGASSGIGAAIATNLARAGAKVALAARRVDKLTVVKEAIENESGIAITVQTDVTDRHSVAEMMKHTEYTLGPVNILVNNAGIMYYTMMKNFKEDEWSKQVDLNIKGVLNCIGATLPGMIERKTGHIVNMSSDAGRKGFPGLAVYSGTKFFIEGMSQALRHEMVPYSIKVTCIQPGDVKTELLSHSTDNEAQEQYDGSSSTKILEPEDIGRAVVYAVTQPGYCAINEILIEPRGAPV